MTPDAQRSLGTSSRAHKRVPAVAAEAAGLAEVYARPLWRKNEEATELGHGSTMTDELDTDHYGNLVLQDSGVRLAVHYMLRQEEAGEVGYLRLAFGQGNLINRILGSVGQVGHLITPAGAIFPVRITSSEPSSAPGYLCVFTRTELPPEV